jgi:DUF1680 family protein
MNQRRPVDLNAVNITDEFWSPRIHANDTSTLDGIYEHLVESGHFNNLKRVANDIRKDKQSAREQRMYRDESDIYKWIEAASYALSRRSDPNLKSKLDNAISLLESAQEDDGYLNSYFSLYALSDRWSNLIMMHELYVAGHLFEAAVAHHNATGERRLMNVAKSFADHICDEFSNRNAAPGHQEVELALVKLYRETSNQRYLEIARAFLDRRGQDDSVFAHEMSNFKSAPCSKDIFNEYQDLLFNDSGDYDGKHVQDHCPVREQSEGVGHAVRAVYMYCAMADVAMETGEEELATAVKRIWDNIIKRRMYLTGGIGSHHQNEGFTQDYHLPTDTAYAETCAAIGNVMWNHRLLQMTGKGKYGDVMEQTLYNGVLAGVSLDGRKFFYTNPLESDGNNHPLDHISQVRFRITRGRWFDTPCCPTNLARLLGSLGRYIYLIEENVISVELFITSSVEVMVGDCEVQLEQETAYPWGETIEININTDNPVEFILRLRIPGWCSDSAAAVNNSPREVDITDGHIRINRTWQDGDSVRLKLPMPVTQVEAHPSLRDVAGQLALKRGPIVYCFEDIDNDVELNQTYLPADGNFTAEYDQHLLDGIVAIHVKAHVHEHCNFESLYRAQTRSETKEMRLTAIPYYAWANRGQARMQVWMNNCDCS